MFNRLLHGFLCLLLISVPCAFSDESERELRPLFDTIVQRLKVMQQVAVYKWHKQLPVEDLQREAYILEQTTERAKRLGLQENPARDFFQAQMNAAKMIQYGWIDQWERNANSVPLEIPDLKNELRPKLSRLGGEIMNLLAAKSFWLSELSSDELCEVLIPKLKIKQLPLTAKREICQSLSQVRTVDSTISVLDKIAKRGVLRVATTGDYPPFSQQKSAGSYQGLDITMAHLLSKRLGVNIQWVETSWPSLLTHLKQKKFDIAMSGISITSERERFGVFSSPYFKGGKAPIAACGNKNRFNSLKKIDRPGVTVIVNPGGTNQRFVDQYISKARVVVYEDNRRIFERLISGAADVMITDAVEVRLQSRLHDQLCATMPKKTFNLVEKAYLMPNDMQLKQYVDTWLQKMQETKQLNSLLKEHKMLL